MQGATQLLRSFGPLVRAARSAPLHGVDLSAEARLAKCNHFFEGVTDLQPRLRILASADGQLGKPAAQLLSTIRAQLL